MPRNTRGKVLGRRPFRIQVQMVVALTNLAAFGGVALLALVAPFEPTTPVLRLPAQSISALEAAILVAFALAAVALTVGRTRLAWRTPLTAPWAVFVVVGLVAAVGSPVSRVNALHMAGRMAAAFGVFLLTVNAATTETRRGALAGALVAGGVLVAALAILEYLGVDPILRLLTAFRPGIATVGAQLRAGGSLQYPTIASMYLEIVFAIGVGLLLAAIDAHAPGHAALLWMALVALGEAIVLTFTRAGLVTMAATLIIAGRSRWRRSTTSDRGLLAIAALGAVVATLFATSRSAESLWLRFTSEGQETWYRASIAAPPRVSLSPRDIQGVPVSVTNTGRLAWDSTADPPFYFSYHWLSAAGDRVVAFEGIRTPFATPVFPGQTARLVAAVRAPDLPGKYRVVWDVVQEGRLWLSTEPGAIAPSSAATVDGSRAGVPIRTMPLPRLTVRPGRLQLWRAATAIVAAHPILGIGLDNFRLAYGRYAGLASTDPRTHSNNMYLEVLAGSGVVGGVVFAWLIWSAARVADAAGIGVACGVVAIGIHGFVDSFLSFAPIYVLFAMTLGLACAQARGVEIVSDAHRV